MQANSGSLTGMLTRKGGVGPRHKGGAEQFEFGFGVGVVGHESAHQSPESRTVVHFKQMGQLMRHHVFNAVHGVVNQAPIQSDISSLVAGSPACFGVGQQDAEWWQFHALRQLLGFLMKNPMGVLLQQGFKGFELDWSWGLGQCDVLGVWVQHGPPHVHGHLIRHAQNGNGFLVGEQIVQGGVLGFALGLPLDIAMDPVRFVLHHLLNQGQGRIQWRGEVYPFAIDQQADGAPCAAFELECAGSPRQLDGVLFDAAHGVFLWFIVCCSVEGFLGLGNGVG